MTDTTLSERLESYTARDVLGLLRTLLVVLIVVPFVIYAVPQVVGADQSYVVMSGSMEPTIGTGDVVIVNEVPTSQIEEGDVITFGGSAAAPPTTHRVIAIQESDGQRVFRTQGDNNEDPDPSPVPASSVRGRVMELPVSVPGADHSMLIIPFIGRVVLFAQTTVGIVTLILAPFVVLAGSELLTFTGGFRGDDESSEAEDSRVTEADGATSGAPATPDATDDPVADEDEGGFTLSIRVLTVAVAGLAALGTFAAQRAYETREPLMATAAVGSIVGCLLVMFVILFGEEVGSSAGQDADPISADQLRTDGSTTVAAESTAATDRTVAGRISPALREWPRTEVDSVERLSEMAEDRGTCVVRDAETGEHVLFDDGVAYTASVPETETEGTADPSDPARDGSNAPDATSESGGADPGADENDDPPVSDRPAANQEVDQ